ncbi:hypothetical protein [Krasilnikovia sp. M28-CT-15]|uniref:hypothetical protein n=1 Tax=Krasilnikovia sp. M28-CT-15 TaxID=3373540 RepID=UPI0038774C55
MSDIYCRLRWDEVPAEVRDALRREVPEPIYAGLANGVLMRVPVLPEDALHIIVADLVHDGGIARTRSFIRDRRLVRTEVTLVDADVVEGVEVGDHTAFVTYRTAADTAVVDVRAEAYAGRSSLA